MKKLLLFAVGFGCFAFVSAQQVEVGADNSFKQSIKGFKTFGWSSEINRIPNSDMFITPSGIYVFNNESTRNRVKKAIKFEMNAKGYAETQNNPDIVVLFRITEHPGKLHTFNGYKIYDEGLDSTHTPQNIQTVNVKPGTLIINILDAKSGMVAWQGYASGILKLNMVNSDVKVREAVAAIFKDFHFHAKK